MPRFTTAPAGSSFATRIAITSLGSRSFSNLTLLDRPERRKPRRPLNYPVHVQPRRHNLVRVQRTRFGTTSSTSAIVTSAAVAIAALKFRDVPRYTRFPNLSALCARMNAKSPRIARSNTYSRPSMTRVSFPSATTVPAPVGVKKAGTPAPPARSRSANVPLRHNLQRHLSPLIRLLKRRRSRRRRRNRERRNRMALSAPPQLGWRDLSPATPAPAAARRSKPARCPPCFPPPSAPAPPAPAAPASGSAPFRRFPQTRPSKSSPRRVCPPPPQPRSDTPCSVRTSSGISNRISLTGSTTRNRASVSA